MSRWDWVVGRARSLWEAARRERSSPREVGLSFGLGVFSACLPTFGFHMWIAIGLATLCRLNRLWAFLGSRASFTPVYALIVFCELESAHKLRTGAWAPLSRSDAIAHVWDRLADLMLGVVLVGGVLGVVATCVAYGLALRLPQDPGRGGDPQSRTPDARPPQSSGSPPSAPPALTP